MDEKHQDETESKMTATDDKSQLSLLTPKDEQIAQEDEKQAQKELDRLSDDGYKVTEEYIYSGGTLRQRSKVSLEHPTRKIWWDWLQLLVIPFVLFFLGIGFTWVQNQTSLQIANDQQQESILKTYLDDMSDLMLNHQLGTSKPGDPVSEMARERTFTTLRRLDTYHNRILLRFLKDAHLIGTQYAVINLRNAILNGAQLSGIDLSGVDLSSADLSSADLSYAILTGATLSGAILNNADLNGAHLNGADLSYAILTGTTLSGADLSDATLTGTNNLTQQQFDTVDYCTNKTLSRELTCHHISSFVTLTYSYTESPAEQPVVLQRIQQFQQQNPNIKINAVYKPFFQAQKAFITASQTGNAPDVLRSDVSWVTQFASQGYLLKIDSYVSQRDLSDYLSIPLSYDSYNRHLYGLPQVTDYLALLYNKSELAKVGITSPTALASMATFEASTMKIVQRKAARYGFETAGTSYYVLPFLMAFGGGWIDQQKHILVNHQESVNGLTFLLKLQNTDQVMPAQVDFNNGYNNMVNDFKSGKTAMIFDGPWEVSNILTGSAFTGNPSNLGIAAIPTGPTGQTGTPVGGQSYVISAHTAHPAEAYKFISFMSSYDNQVAIAEANHTLPTRQSAYQNPIVSSDPVISAFYFIQHTAIARPAIPQGSYLFDAFDLNIQAALSGGKSPADALNAVADAWKQLLAGS